MCEYPASFLCGAPTSAQRQRGANGAHLYSFEHDIVHTCLISRGRAWVLGYSRGGGRWAHTEDQIRYSRSITPGTSCRTAARDERERPLLWLGEKQTCQK